MRGSFVFDQNSCTGCDACRLACTIENELPLNLSWRRIHTLNPSRFPGVPVVHLSLACNHCADPTCLTACPALAYSRDGGSGAVLLDENKCIGCRYCSWACPFDAPVFDVSRGVMTKCTFCIERLQAGQAPACTQLCPTGALRYARLPEEEITNVADGFLPTPLGPAIKIVPWCDGLPPETAGATAQTPPPRDVTRRVSLRGEWPLLAFSFLIASLFGAFAARVVGGVGVSAPMFLGIAALGLAVSGVHLGRRLRAWRAVLNVRHSWLSREIALFGLFVSSGFTYLVLTPEKPVVGWLAIAFGLALLFAVDRVYQFAVMPGPRIPHSASLALTGPLLAGVLLLDPAFLVVFGASKTVLYVTRRVVRGQAGLGWDWRASVVRLGFGLLAPAALWAINGSAYHAPVILAVVVGEFADRFEFYRELDFASPARQMGLDFEWRLNPPGDTRSSRRLARS